MSVRQIAGRYATCSWFPSIWETSSSNRTSIDDTVTPVVGCKVDFTAWQRREQRSSVTAHRSKASSVSFPSGGLAPLFRRVISNPAPEMTAVSLEYSAPAL
jgi:hypothetical protein